MNLNKDYIIFEIKDQYMLSVSYEKESKYSILKNVIVLVFPQKYSKMKYFN